MQDKIKIAFVLDQIDYQMGGTEKQILMILDNIDTSRYEIHLCFFRKTQWIEDHKDRYRMFFFDFPSFKSLGSYREFLKFVRYLKKQNFDILVSFFTDSNKIGVPAALLAGIRNIVLSRRNFSHWVSGKELFILKLLKPFITSYWVNAGAIKNRIAAQERISPDRIDVIYNGFKLDRPAVKQDLALFSHIQQSKIVINVSNLRQVKGLDVYLKAASEVVSADPDVHFAIVGEGDQRASLEALIDELGLQQHVTLAGKQSDIATILQCSDIGVLSSHSEGLSNAIIEYMANGLPVVCTEVGGAAEMIEDGVNGFLVAANEPQALGQRILQLVRDEQLRNDLGEKSRARANAMFRCEAMIHNLGSYFDRLACRRSETEK